MTNLINPFIKFVKKDILLFSSNYDDTLTWVKTSTFVTVNEVYGDKVGGTGNAGIGVQCAETTPLGFTISDTIWRAEFNLEFFTVSGNWYSIPFVLASGSGNIETANQDCVGITFSDNGLALPQMFGCYKLGAGSFTQVNPSAEIDIPKDVLTYIRIERTEATKLKLSAFSDSDRTIHLTNSPQIITIADVKSMTFLQHSHRADSANNTSKWSIGTMRIYSDLA